MAGGLPAAAATAPLRSGRRRPRRKSAAGDRPRAKRRKKGGIDNHRRRVAAPAVAEAKSIEGLWVGYYDNVRYELVRVTLNGDEAVATKVIGDNINIVPAGKISWEASVTSGVAQVQAAHDGFTSPYWIRARLTERSTGCLVITGRPRKQRVRLNWSKAGLVSLVFCFMHRRAPRARRAPVFQQLSFRAVHD